ncbi:hypothetical protein HY251_05830 [bacterium]|nr:hypothetical protein [bacterium]
MRPRTSARARRGKAILAPGALVLVLLALAPEARAADTVAPRIGSEPPARTKVERFLGKLPTTSAEAARARLVSGETAARDLLHALLLDEDSHYRTAVLAFSRDGANAEEFLDLVPRATGPLARALEAHATFFAGRAFLNRHEFDRAASCFEKVRGELASGTPWTDEATLELAQSYLRRPEADPARTLLQRKRARACLEALAPRSGPAVYTECPERERDTAALLLLELDGPPETPWRGLARELESITRSIEQELADKPDERKHQQMLAAAERLLHLLRENGEDGRARSLVRMPRAPAKPTAAPDWGSLSPSERAGALGLLRERFPERYRELIEQYMRVIAVSKDDPGKKP